MAQDREARGFYFHSSSANIYSIILTPFPRLLQVEENREASNGELLLARRLADVAVNVKAEPCNLHLLPSTRTALYSRFIKLTETVSLKITSGLGEAKWWLAGIRMHTPGRALVPCCRHERNDFVTRLIIFLCR